MSGISEDTSAETPCHQTINFSQTSRVRLQGGRGAVQSLAASSIQPTDRPTPSLHAVISCPAHGTSAYSRPRSRAGQAPTAMFPPAWKRGIKSIWKSHVEEGFHVPTSRNSKAFTKTAHRLVPRLPGPVGTPAGPSLPPHVEYPPHMHAAKLGGSRRRCISPGTYVGTGTGAIEARSPPSSSCNVKTSCFSMRSFGCIESTTPSSNLERPCSWASEPQRLDQGSSPDLRGLRGGRHCKPCLAYCSIYQRHEVSQRGARCAPPTLSPHEAACGI